MLTYGREVEQINTTTPGIINANMRHKGISIQSIVIGTQGDFKHKLK